MKRFKHIDAVAGFLILFMVYTHIAQLNFLQGDMYLRLNRLVLFYMAWFFYKSGHFYRERSWNEEKKVLWSKFLVPFLMFSLLGTLVHSVHLFLTGDSSIASHILVPLKDILMFGSLEGNKPLWFLLTLILVRILFKLTGTDKQVLIPGSILSVVAAWLCHTYVSVPYYIGNTFLGFFFFSLGYLLKDWEENKYLAYVAILVYLAFVVYLPSIFDFRGNTSIFGHYFVFPIEAAAGIVALNNVAHRVCRHFTPRMLCFAGRQALLLYVCHWIIYGIVQIIWIDLLHYPAGTKCAFVMAGAFCLLFLVVLCTSMVRKKSI